jgi:4-amino-4-deoxy-L-arabinose transferase-like glycosyltransferase
MIFGESVFVMKIVSIIPVLLTVILSAKFIKNEFGNKACVLLLLCFISSKTIILYSLEIRSYGWALFFTTAAAVTVYYGIKDNKNKYYIAFLFCALGAAYTHYYAAVTVGIGYIMLLCFTFRCNKKRIPTVVLVAVCALALYLPWLPVAMTQFSKVSSDFWLGPVTFKTVHDYVTTIFSTAGTAARRVLLISFCFTLVLFAKRKGKIFKDYFLFCVLCCLITLALFGTAISIVVRPMFFSKYLIPACGFVWLFYAMESSLIKVKWINLLQCSVLCVFGVLTFLSLMVSEKQENKDFTEFYTYTMKHIMPDDIIVFNDDRESGHMMGIMAYLFPGHTQAFIEQPHENVFNNGFDRTIILYSTLGNTDNKGKWIIFENEQNEQQDNIAADFEPGKRFCGDFGWGGYSFKLYYLD